jgi:peptidoglycan L-alanyl-D-glutamate endopeptidase CwlK
MTFKLAARSIARLDQAHPDLRRVVEHAITLSPIDFTVTETLRTLKRQQQLVTIGASMTMDSRHLAHPSDGLSRAVDPAALVNGKVRWDGPLYYQISEAMRQAAKVCNVAITWGNVWDHCLNDLSEDLEVETMEYIARRKALGKKAFLDSCHWELWREVYP